MDYYRKKKGWHSRVLSTIDWEAIEALIRKATPTKKNRIIQVLHDWQNVGKQKGKFRDSRLGKIVEPPLQPTVEEISAHKCPLGCGATEDHLHYVKCQAPKALHEREQLRKTMLGRLKKLKTNEFMISFTGYMVKMISMGDEVQLDDISFATEDERALLPALLGQQEIGWEELLKGFPHVGWAKAQSDHYRRNGLHSKLFSERRWKRMFINILTDYSNECWQMRNDVIHGDEKDKGNSKKRSGLLIK